MIGLDIGTAAVKAAQVQRQGKRYAVTGLARAAIEPADGREDNGDAIAAAIQRCLYLLGGKEAGQVVCGLAGPDVTVRPFDLPALVHKHVASAIELEAAQVCPFDVHEGVVAFQVLRGPSGKGRGRGGGKGEPPERMTGILAAARQEAMERVRRWCRRAETRCIILDVAGLALLNCLEACGPEAGGPAVLVLDVGATYTNLALLAADGQPFVQDIEHGGTEIVRLAAESAHRTPEAVLAALAGSEEAEISHKNLRSGLRKACAPLAEQVLETLRYHGARKGGCGVEKVLLCGGVAQAEAVVEVLGGLLERPVERWDPLASLAPVRRVRKSELAGHGPLFAVALGLAMRSVHDVPN